MGKTINTRIKQKHDFEVNWLKATNFKPLDGELIVYDAEVDSQGSVLLLPNGDSVLPSGRTTPFAYPRIKIGDGATFVNDLPFANKQELASITEDGLLSKEDKSYINSLMSVMTTDQDGLLTSISPEFYIRTPDFRQEFIIGESGGPSDYRFNTASGGTAVSIDTDPESNETTVSFYVPTVFHDDPIVNGEAISTVYETKSDAANKLAEAKEYADGVKNDLLNGAGGAYDTLKELGELIEENADAIEAMQTVAVNQAKEYTDANKIIDVPELPTTDIKETATYRVLDGIFIVNKLLKHESVCHIVSWDSVPSTGGESAIVESASGFEYVGYYNMQNNVLYGYVNDASKDALKSFIDKSDLEDYQKNAAKLAVNLISNGWKTLSELIDVMGSFTKRSWGGIITSQAAATNVDGIYLYLESKQYFYQHGAWVELHAGLGRYGTGTSSEIFNTAENIASGEVSHAEGYQTEATANYAHSEGLQTKANGYASHAEGSGTVTTGTIAHAEGLKTKAHGNQSHTEGRYTYAGGQGAHAEGKGSDDAELYNTYGALGEYSHSEGNLSTASGKYAHAEGWETKAIGNASHTEGYKTEAASSCGHAEGQDTKALGQFSHSEGYKTTAAGGHQHVQGKYNIPDVSRDADGNMLDADGNVTTDVKAAKPLNKYAHIVGNGTSTKQSNAHTLDWNGNAWFAGEVSADSLNVNKFNINAPFNVNSGDYYKVHLDNDGNLAADLQSLYCNLSTGNLTIDASMDTSVGVYLTDGDFTFSSTCSNTSSFNIETAQVKIGPDFSDHGPYFSKTQVDINGSINCTGDIEGNLIATSDIDVIMGQGQFNFDLYAVTQKLEDGNLALTKITDTTITSINIPSNVTEIPIAANSLIWCGQLESITADAENPVYHSKQNCLIETDTKTLVRGGICSKIPNDGSVTTIGARAFQDCTKLTNIVIPRGITTIGGYAFLACSSLSNIDLPWSVVTINDGAFGRCYGLTNITFPYSFQDLGSRLFGDSSDVNGDFKITNITFEGTPNSISSSAFVALQRLPITINVPWSEGEVANAPWGATNATINYNYGEGDEEV